MFLITHLPFSQISWSLSCCPSIFFKIDRILIEISTNERPASYFSQPIRSSFAIGRQPFSVSNIWAQYRHKIDAPASFLVFFVCQSVWSWVQSGCTVLAKMWRLVGCSKTDSNWLLNHKLSQYVWHAIGKRVPFGRENGFCKTACSGGHESGFPDFERSCVPNYWHQVNL